MKRRIALFPLAAAAVIGLAACGGTTAGVGSAAPAGSVQQSGGGAASTPGHSGPSLASVSPCALLSAADLSQFQLTKTDSGTALGARSCAWKNTTADNGFGYGIGFDLRDAQGLAGVSTDNTVVTDDPIGSHPGKQSKGVGGGLGCIVTIGVTSSSRVDVNTAASTDSTASCALANQFAKLIEPRLPPAAN